MSQGKDDSQENHLKESAEHLSVIPYYIIGLLATTVGIMVVGLLNFFTPLEFIQTRVLGPDRLLTLKVMFTFLLPKFLFVLGTTYIAVIYLIRQMTIPISRCLKIYRQGGIPDESELFKARKRLLNLHFIFVPLNVFIWILIPGVIAVFSKLAGVLDFRTAVILGCRASMVGLVASTIASQRMEAISRVQLIPFFFPDGRLTDTGGAAKLSISKRIILVSRLGAVVPITILLITLLTLQWDVANYDVSAVDYGRGILLFTFILFLYTMIASKHMNMMLSRNIIEPINDLVRVLREIHKGRFSEKVRVVSNDEIGYAGEVVNEMTLGLKEREEMRKSLDLAAEIQQNLLPQNIPDVQGVDISGTSLYCDETGGDYYDFIGQNGESGGGIRIVLGDVSGHGISSALLMATSRALFRQRSAMDGSLAQITSDVNRQLCNDVKGSGNFITLFALGIDGTAKCMKWVRAGHDPAMIYRFETDDFSFLKGSGIALGLDETFEYEENEISDLSEGDIIVLYTDGIWEAKNGSGDQFGKESLMDMIRKNASASSKQIVEQVMASLEGFQNGKDLQDDATLVVVKVL